MDIIKTFVTDQTEHCIDIHYKDGAPVFRANQIGKILGIINIHHAIVKFDSTEKRELVCTDSSGRNQEMTVLTKHGVYELLSQSRKPIAKTFRKWVYRVLDEIESKGRYDVQQQADLIVAAKEQELTMLRQSLDTTNEALVATLASKQMDIDTARNDAASAILMDVKEKAAQVKHDMFTATSKNCSLVYLATICEVDGKTVVKIGSTSDLKTRALSLKRTFGNFTVFEIFPVQRHEAFERFLQNKSEFKRFQYREPLFKGNKSIETYLLNAAAIRSLIVTAQRNCAKYDKTKDQLKIEKLSLKLDRMSEHMGISIASDDSDSDEDDAGSVTVLGKRGFASADVKGRQIQRYSLADDWICTYSRIGKIPDDKEFNGIKISVASVRNSITRAQSYRGYRFCYLERSAPADTVQTLPALQSSAKYNTGTVAQLDSTKTTVLHVFANSTVANESTSYTTVATFNSRLENGQLIDNYYYQRWTELPAVVRATFTGELPEVKENRAFIIDQIKNKVVVKSWGSCEEICRAYQLTLTTLKDAMNGETELRESIWKKQALVK